MAKKSSNPVGRPKKKYGAETLMETKKSFKLNNNNVVLDKYGAVILIVACIVLYLAVK